MKKINILILCFVTFISTISFADFNVNFFVKGWKISFSRYTTNFRFTRQFDSIEIENILIQHDKNLKQKLLLKVDEMEPRRFEDFIVDSL